MDSAVQRRRTNITRTRQLVACTECRRRKLKCDHRKPSCTSCKRRGEEGGCIYQRFAGNGVEKGQAEARLENLERIVQRLARSGGDSAKTGILPEVAEQMDVAEADVLVSEGPVFSGSTHWSAMLADIQGLRSAIIPGEAPTTDDGVHECEDNIGANLILGSTVPLSIRQVLAQYLPSRQEADRLTSAYFRSRGASAPFIHASYFRRLYQEFWKDPTSAPALWTSILFSICHIAKNTLALGQAEGCAEKRFSVASAHCLGLGEYFRPKRFSVESLLLFVQAQCMTGLAVSHDLGLILGLTIRLATRMGYHRDPDMFPLSAFEREMRRRTWSLCLQLDLLISFQLGLPSNIQYPTWDTGPPRNLQDSDFDEDTKELPPARPDSESTDILFYIAKHKLMTVFEKILRHTMSTARNESADIDQLDNEIRNVYLALPEVLRPRAMADSVVDSSSLTVTRLCVFFIYQKSLCVLHRPYVTRGRVHSIEVCQDAASNILRYFNDTYQEFLPGGQLETERWFMSNITWNDYLLGAVGLCLTLCASDQYIAADQVEPTEALQLLQRTRDVCGEQSVRSKGSGRVQRVVNATLLRFGSWQPEDAMTGNGASKVSEEFPLTGSPFVNGQTSAHDVMPPRCLQELGSEQTGIDWTGGEDMARPIEDTSWAYLEQFLNLSDIDLLPSTLT